PVIEVAQSAGFVDDVTWLDTDIEPSTYYGYRVITVTRFGDRSIPSVVGGLKSPELPGIQVQTASAVTANSSTDPNGYDLAIVGPDTIRTTIGQTQARVFSPLKVGTYQVSISGLAAQCLPSGPTTASVVVTDTLATTIAPVTFNVACKDPSRG